MDFSRLTVGQRILARKTGGLFVVEKPTPACIHCDLLATDSYLPFVIIFNHIQYRLTLTTLL